MMLALFARAGLEQLAGQGLRLAAAASAGAVRQFSSQVALTNKGNRFGPGGRSSVSGVTATIFGANGFVGSYVTNEIARKGAQVVVPFRSTENDMQHIKQMGDLGQIVMLSDFDIRDEEMIRYSLSRSNVVINMIGQRTETMNFGFEDVHVKWPQRLAKIVSSMPNVERLIHFSEMGVSESHPSRRFATKAKGDRLLMEACPSATIVKPGPVVGIEDHFYNYIIYQLSFGILAPVYEGGAAKLQPTWVRDVADATVALLGRPESKGQTYYLGGPETMSLREVYDVIINTLRLHTDDTLHVPADVAKLALKPLDALRRKLPGLPGDSPLNSVDYVEESTRDKLPPRGALGYADLGLKPAKVTDGLAIEPVRTYRVGGYRWGDMASVAKDVPEAIRKYYNIK